MNFIFNDIHDWLKENTLFINGDKMGFLKKAIRKVYDDPKETKLTRKVSEKLDEISTK